MSELFATLTEVPILQGLFGVGMGKGPASLAPSGRSFPVPSQHVGDRRGDESYKDSYLLYHYRGYVNNHRDGVWHDSGLTHARFLQERKSKNA